MLSRHIKIVITLVIAIIGLSLASSAFAITIVPPCARGVAEKAPSLGCIMETFANISQLILGITGSLALLYFVWGGFTWLTSGGSPEQVKKGKEILLQTIIAIIIIFGAYVAIVFIQKTLLGRYEISKYEACVSDCLSSGNTHVDCELFCEEQK